jgi:hypothetical protein
VYRIEKILVLRRKGQTSNQRVKALPKWLRYYLEQRPDRAPGHDPAEGQDLEDSVDETLKDPQRA